MLSVKHHSITLQHLFSGNGIVGRFGQIHVSTHVWVGRRVLKKATANRSISLAKFLLTSDTHSRFGHWFNTQDGYNQETCNGEIKLVKV
jgi:hypothetical protein